MVDLYYAILTVNPANGNHFCNCQDEYNEWSTEEVDQVQNELTSLKVDKIINGSE